jgi:hypothetical protein
MIWCRGVGLQRENSPESVGIYHRRRWQQRGSGGGGGGVAGRGMDAREVVSLGSVRAHASQSFWAQN